MANTVNLNSDMTEYSTTDAELESQLDSLASLVKGAKSAIFFTGAGISTSGGISDYRGPDGVWTRQAKGLAPAASKPMTAVTPTACHMAMVELLRNEASPFKYIVSQNVDGLHRRSGVGAASISELHGNIYKELCWNAACGHHVMHKVEVRGGTHGNGCCKHCLERVPFFCHCTGRKCPGCEGRLKDSIIHFKENLPMEAIERGFANAVEADLCVVLGSSLTVSPACDIPRECVKTGGKLVVVNLQKTPLDPICALRLHAKTDTVIEGLMKRVEMDIPAFEEAAKEAAEAAEEDSVLGAAAAGAGAGAGAKGITTDDELADADAAALRGFGFQVAPLNECKHACDNVETDAEAILAKLPEDLMAAGCAECGSTDENWVCAKCLGVHCGRHVKGHGVSHAVEAGHCVAMGLRDLSFWCHCCEGYLNNYTIQELIPLYVRAHECKFKAPPPKIGQATFIKMG